MSLIALMADLERIDAAGLRDEAFPFLQRLREARDAGIIDITDGPRARPAFSAGSRAFRAQRAGQCVNCDTPIGAGDLIVWSRDSRTAQHSPTCPKRDALPPDEMADLAGALLAQLQPGRRQP